MLPAVTIYTDGGSRGNPGPAAIGIVLCDARDRLLREHKEFLGTATNNEAEYRAVLRGLKLAARYTRGSVTCVADSELVVRQLTGVYRARSPAMKELLGLVREQEASFEQVRYRNEPRLAGRLRRADELVNEALDRATR